jgi:succinate dehydrogenase / fumarate reductase iron-sulfur subunit
VDCIECGLCISACPISAISGEYLGPAVLAAARHNLQLPEVHMQVNSRDGVWRCHSVFECTAVCPSNVDPGWRIMELRRKVVGDRIKTLFNPRKTAQVSK